MFTKGWSLFPLVKIIKSSTIYFKLNKSVTNLILQKLAAKAGRLVQQNLVITVERICGRKI